MNSSYKSHIDFSSIFATITFMKNPKKILEFGILEGFSLNTFIENSSSECIIEANDIFEDFIGNHASYINIINLFQNHKNVIINKSDFYMSHIKYLDNSIDIIHIDIANTGDTYEFAIQNYFQKLKYDGVMILEGGSEKRDNVNWMMKYNKSKILPVINKYKNQYDILIIDNINQINQNINNENSANFGCITIIKNKLNLFK